MALLGHVLVDVYAFDRRLRGGYLRTWFTPNLTVFYLRPGRPMHKLVHLIYGVLKSGVPFDAEYVV